MKISSDEFARVLLAWVETLEPEAERVALEIAATSNEEWQTLVASLPRPIEADAICRVISRAHDLLARDPAGASRLARLALRMTQHINKTCSDPDLIEGDAWRESAAAHLELAEYADAYDAVEKAHACYSRTSAGRINAAILSLIEGRTLFDLGRYPEAIAAVEHGAAELLDTGADRKKYVQARTIHAVILVGMGQPDAALDVFSSAADLAMKAGDKETLAYIMWNTGLCAARLEDTARAKRCLDSALQYFEGLGLKAEVPHVRSAMVATLRVQRRYNEAISELYKIRAEFLALGIPVRAARSALEIVELLLLCGRLGDVTPLCKEMVETFRAARLQRNLLQALAYLTEVARRRQLASSDVTYVAAFFERAQNDPDAGFRLPA
jgi:tetratricopeptide (TPR) repeat protein